VLSRSDIEYIATKRVDGFAVEVDPAVEWVGSGSQLSLIQIESAAVDVLDGMNTWPDTDVDRYEGQMAQRLYDALAHVPTEILDDRGFWRFLAAKYFWDFIVWRQAGAFVSSGKYLKYVDATTNTEAVLVRMYLRAAALGGQGTEQLAGGIVKAGDFWRSHIIRVQTGSAPPLATAFAEKQYKERLTTGPVREAAKRLTRVWSNVIMHVYNEDEARDIVSEIWSLD